MFRNDRIICKAINDGEDEFIYMRITDSLSQSSAAQQEDTLQQIKELNEDVLDHPEYTSTPGRQFNIMIEATDGLKNYNTVSEVTNLYVEENRIRSNNALSCISDDALFVEFMYKFLVLGTYDINPEYDMIVTSNEEEGDIELTIVKTSGDYAIKLFSLQLEENKELVIDLFQWFHLISERCVNLFKTMNHIYKLNKLNEFKVNKLIDDNEVVMSNYDKIKMSSEKFMLLLNAKKRKILELSGGDESSDVFCNLNYDRREVEKYDIVNRSSIDLGELSAAEDDTKLVKRRKIKKEEEQEPMLEPEVVVKREEEEPQIKVEGTPSPPLVDEEDEDVTDYTTDEEE